MMIIFIVAIVALLVGVLLGVFGKKTVEELHIVNLENGVEDLIFDESEYKKEITKLKKELRKQMRITDKEKTQNSEQQKPETKKENKSKKSPKKK